MQAFAAAVNERGDRQFQLAVEGVLLRDRERVRLNQGIMEPGHVLVPHTDTVHGIEPDPCSGLRLPVSYGRPDIVRMLTQRGDQFSGSTVKHAFARFPFAVLILPGVVCDIADTVLRIKEKFQIRDKILHGVPGRGRRKAGEAVITVMFDVVIPAQAAVLTEHRPAAFFRHLNDGAAFDGLVTAPEPFPEPFTLAGVIAAVVPGPIIPDGAGIALLLERHAYGDPVGTGKFGYVYGLEGRENIGFHVLCSFRSVCTGVVAVRNTPVVIGKP